MKPSQLVSRLPKNATGETAMLVRALSDILRSLDDIYSPLLSGDGNLLVGQTQTNTDATRGFIYIPRFQGKPTGDPPDYNAGVPFGYDEVNDTIYVYDFAETEWKPFGADEDTESVLWVLILLELERIYFA